jgi:hypothetical protein
MYGLTGIARVKHFLWLVVTPIIGAAVCLFGASWYLHYRDAGQQLETYQMGAEGVVCMMIGSLGLLVGTIIGMIGAWRVQSGEIARRRVS